MEESILEVALDLSFDRLRMMTMICIYIYIYIYIYIHHVKVVTNNPFSVFCRILDTYRSVNKYCDIETEFP